MPRNRMIHSSGLRQNGQALTEFLVVALALIPLFLLIPVIAKYQDISHSTQMASRYVAFEATRRYEGAGGNKSEEQLAEEVRRRYFSNPDAPIKTGDVAGDFKAHQNLFWRDPRGNSLIPTLSRIEVRFGDSNAPQQSAAFRAASDGRPFSAPLANAQRIGLSAQGIYRAHVVVPLANLPAGLRSYEPFDRLNLEISRNTSVVVDPWTSRSPQQTEDRFGRLAPVQDLLSSGVEALVGAGISVFELGQVSPPRFGRLEQWRDVVPADRLQVAQP